MCRKLTAVAINEPNEAPEYIVFEGEDAWGWIGRVDLDGEFAGFQVVAWTETMITMRLQTWDKVAHFLRHPESTVHHSWVLTTDEYAADVLRAEAEELAERDAAFERERAERLAAEAERAAQLAAAHAGAMGRYHGSMTDWHGRCRVLGPCECDECDGVLDASNPRLAVQVAGLRLEHVRLASVTLDVAQRQAA